MTVCEEVCGQTSIFPKPKCFSTTEIQDKKSLLYDGIPSIHLVWFNVISLNENQSNLVEAIELVEPIEYISQSNVIESIEKIRVIFDWYSIAFGNRISVVRLRSTAFN